MCSVIFFNQQFFARNMDISFEYHEKMICIPKNYIIGHNQKSMQCKYAMMGLGNLIANFPLLAEGINEKGLCVATLALKNSTKYQKEDSKKLNLASFEIIPYILANFSSVFEVKDYFKFVNITDEDFNSQIKNTPQHWIVSDINGSIIIEQTDKGLKVYDNPYHILTNEPPFDKQIENIKKEVKNNTFNKENLKYDFTSISRFMRGCYLKENAYISQNYNENLSQALNLIQQLSVIKGCVYDEKQKLHYTVYTSCIDCLNKTYFYKNYKQINYQKFILNEKLINQSEIITFDLM